MIPKNMTFHTSTDSGYPGVIILWAMWDVFKGEEHHAVFGNRFVFHENFSEEQLDKVVLDGVKRLKEEWKSVTDFPASFLDKSKAKIREKVREEHGRANESNTGI